MITLISKVSFNYLSIINYIELHIKTVPSFCIDIDTKSINEVDNTITQKVDIIRAEVGIVTPKVDEGNVHTYHQYTILVDSRDDLMEYLDSKGIAARVYYPVPLHLQPCYQFLGYSEGSLPVSEELSKKVLSLPIYPELTDEKTNYIIENIANFFKNREN